MKKYRKAVFIVTYLKTKKGIRYLILKRKLHWVGWEFPKGGLEKKEREIQGVKRELKEETGQIGFNIKKFNISGKYGYNPKLKDRKEFVGQTYTLYSAQIKKREVKIDAREHSKYKWAKFNKALRKLTWPNQKKCLKIVNNSLKK